MPAIHQIRVVAFSESPEQYLERLKRMQERDGEERLPDDLIEQDVESAKQPSALDLQFRVTFELEDGQQVASAGDAAAASIVLGILASAGDAAPTSIVSDIVETQPSQTPPPIREQYESAAQSAAEERASDRDWVLSEVRGALEMTGGEGPKVDLGDSVIAAEVDWPSVGAHLDRLLS